MGDDLVAQLLAKIQAMPEKQRLSFKKEVVDATSKDWKYFIPNAGPQLRAYDSKADILLYGGSAGGGKSSLIMGLSANEHERTLIMRRRYTDLGSLTEELLKIVGTRDGFRGGMRPLMRLGKKVIEFGAAANPGDEEGWQGQAHDLLCVGRGTQVLMADGSYTAIEHLGVGDYVETLEGPRRVTRLIPRRVDLGVRVQTVDETGAVLAEQFQSRSHSLLSANSSWDSYSSILSAYQCGQSICSPPIVSDACDRWLRQFSKTYQACLRLLLKSTSSLWRMAQVLLATSDHWYRLEPSSFYGQSILEIGDVSSYGLFQDAPLPHGSFCHLTRRSHSHHSVLTEAYLQIVSHDADDDFSLSRSLGSRDDCQRGLRSYDAQLQICLRPQTELNRGQESSLRQDDAVRPIPTCFAAGVPEQTPTHTSHKGTYAHPYTTEIRPAYLEQQTQTCRFTPVGEIELFDIEVDQANHYITKGGFINKNCFDEAVQFLEAQIRFLMTWVRSATPGQRCRTILASNPPVSAQGQWVISMFRPWLDITYSRPAKNGELRWFVTDPDDRDMEVDGPDPVQFPGTEKPVIPKSRTFIQAFVKDNPYLVGTDYEATLDALKGEMRAAMRDGNFMASRKDAPDQMIPTAWVRQAMDRWTPRPPEQTPMCALAADIAAGGDDTTTLTWRHDWWFAPFIQVPGKQTPNGTDVAGLVVKYRRDGSVVVLDMGGGYGGGPKDHLEGNGIKVIPYKGAMSTTKRTEDKTYGFTNVRTEAYWKFREALDPDQPGGSPIALPDDPELMAELTMPTFTILARGIQMMVKEKVCELLGRSPDKADAAIMCWYGGPRGYVDMREWSQHQGVGRSGRMAGRRPTVVMSTPKQQRQPATMNGPRPR